MNNKYFETIQSETILFEIDLTQNVQIIIVLNLGSINSESTSINSIKIISIFNVNRFQIYVF